MRRRRAGFQAVIPLPGVGGSYVVAAVALSSLVSRPHGSPEVVRRLCISPRYDTQAVNAQGRSHNRRAHVNTVRQIERPTNSAARRVAA